MKHFLIGIFALMSCLPATASAELQIVRTTGGSKDVYESSAQYAHPVSETMALYQIDYYFGHGSYDLYLPARAVRDLAWDTNNERIGYSIMEDGKRVSESGTSLGVVISSAELTEDEMYYVPKGSVKKFSLFIILETEPNDLESDYAVSVTNLPFYRYDEREYLRLNPSELQYYITPEIEFNVSNPSAS